MIKPFRGSWPVTFRFWAVYGSWAGRLLKGKHHKGVDFAMPTGTPLISTVNGKVIERRPLALSWSYGNTIMIEDSDHDKRIRYAHMKDFAVKKGQKVKEGQLIGRSDNTGASKGAHLHFELMVSPKKENKWKLVDPLKYIK